MNAILSASRFQGSDEMIPRFREARDVTLDLVHRDGGYYLDASGI